MLSDDDLSKPPSEWLNHLHEAGQWSRLVEIALRSLAVDPNDTDTHRHLGWAYAKMGRLADMKPHIDFLLTAEPDEPRNHHLAAIYHLDSKRHGPAKTHIDALLFKDPQNPNYHYLACIHALRANNVQGARGHIHKARALAPEWPAAAHLEIEIDGIGQQKASAAWHRIRRLKEALALDPRNAAMLTSIGVILLTELEQPREAEAFLRDALVVQPTDKALQRTLFDAIRARSLFYRTLSLPLTAARSLRAQLRAAGLRVVLWIIAFKVVLAFLAWLLVAALFFGPAAKVYEWFVLAEVTRARGLPRILRPLGTILGWPLSLRLALSLSIIVGGWVLLFRLAFQTSPAVTLEVMGCAFAFHFLLVSSLVGVRKLRARLGRQEDAHHQKRIAPRSAANTEATETA
jgi:tetratricopeptide (TPR) repeat protein